MSESCHPAQLEKHIMLKIAAISSALVSAGIAVATLALAGGASLANGLPYI
jgi:hypothetical protein